MLPYIAYMDPMGHKIRLHSVFHIASDPSFFEPHKYSRVDLESAT